MVASGEQPETNNIPKRLDAVTPIDLLPLVIGAPIVADADLVYAPTAGKRDLRAQLNLAATEWSRQMENGRYRAAYVSDAGIERRFAL
jgi:hypothetical protein